MEQHVIIVGAGPAGLTAAIYLARDGYAPLVIEGPLAGGQLATTSEVENFPGFPEGVMGPVLMQSMREQAARFGAQFIDGSVTKVDLTQTPRLVVIDEDKKYPTKTVIIATGSSPRRLGIDAEKELWGHGVSTCATCDAFFYREKEVVVIGGGDSALEEALFLTRFAGKVTVIHRRDSLRASKAMQDKAFANDKIKFLWDGVVEDIHDVSSQQVTAVVVKNVKTEEISEYACDGVFLAIGHMPNTAFLQGALDCDEHGYIRAVDGTATSCEGVFTCGDVADPRYKQAITAAGNGCQAALDTEKYLENSN